MTKYAEQLLNRQASAPATRLVGSPHQARTPDVPQSSPSPFSDWPALIRISRVAEYFCISVDHVAALIDSGQIEAINIASPGVSRPAYRILRESFIAYIERRSK